MRDEELCNLITANAIPPNLLSSNARGHCGPPCPRHQLCSTFKVCVPIGAPGFKIPSVSPAGDRQFKAWDSNPDEETVE